jgi:hypothetical protein
VLRKAGVVVGGLGHVDAGVGGEPCGRQPLGIATAFRWRVRHWNKKLRSKNQQFVLIVFDDTTKLLETAQTAG